MISKKTKEFRENFVKEFLDSIENPRALDWREPWKVTGMPENAVTGKRYNGLNLVYLNHMANVFNKEDNRWATFNQIKDKGWFLKKGSKGFKVEYWIPFDLVGGKMQAITWDEYRDLEDKTNVIFSAKYYTVFNGDDIVGIPEVELKEAKQDIKADELVERLSKNMDVEISYTGGNYAFYSPKQDRIFLPEANSFDSEYDLNATALHELAHATGAEHRLNRDLEGSYAFEELIAELTSCFMANYVDVPKTEMHLDNHKAYLKGWAKEIKNDPNYLFNAIKKSYEATEYLEEKGELSLDKTKILEVSNENIANGLNDFKKFGISLDKDGNLISQSEDEKENIWINKDGEIKGNTDKLNIWLCDKGMSIDEATRLLKEIERFYGFKIQESDIHKLIDLEDLQEMPGGEEYVSKIIENTGGMGVEKNSHSKEISEEKTRQKDKVKNLEEEM